MKNRLLVAILLLVIVIVFFGGCVQDKPFSENQVSLIVSGNVPITTSDSGVFSTLTIFNQSNKQINIGIGDITCEICGGQSFQPAFVKIPPNSSAQVRLNGELNKNLLSNKGSTSPPAYTIPDGAIVFTMKYSVEGEATGSFHILQYKR